MGDVTTEREADQDEAARSRYQTMRHRPDAVVAANVGMKIGWKSSISCPHISLSSMNPGSVI
ncbi:hypothetical protein V1278_001943 [Bradyrhizobium sp. AZCC 1577]|uniref:hypothetical protein n=1 Tax=Bradyrhizobium sp. AZCC 1577 TaxID=3117019 RepID=UPI002FF0C39E